MKRMMESFWRALLDSFRLRVIGLTLLPLAVIAVVALLLGYFFWSSAVASVSMWMNNNAVWGWMNGQMLHLGVQNATAFMAPLLIVMLVLPILIIFALLLVTVFMTPVLTGDVVRRRFALIERRGGDGFWQSLGWSSLSTLMAVGALLLTLPLWLIPPLAVILPPLIWGWLAYRVMSFDVLVRHASRSERKIVFAQHRWPLLVIGVICGFLGMLPGVLWASSIVFSIAFFVLIPISIWLFTWVFAFTSLWYAHYCLDALNALRAAIGPDGGSSGSVATGGTGTIIRNPQEAADERREETPPARDAAPAKVIDLPYTPAPIEPPPDAPPPASGPKQ